MTTNASRIEPEIDCSDCVYTIHIPQRTRLSIYNHMRAFLVAEIEKRGFVATDPKLFSMLTIEDKAMELTDDIIAWAEVNFTEVTNDTVSFLDAAPAPAGDEVQNYLAEAVPQAKAEFLSPENVDNIDTLIQLASGTPLSIAGTDAQVDLLARGHARPCRRPPEK